MLRARKTCEPKAHEGRTRLHYRKERQAQELHIDRPSEKGDMGDQERKKEGRHLSCRAYLGLTRLRATEQSITQVFGESRLNQHYSY